MTSLISIVVIAVSLALDALSVSVAGGLNTQKATAQDAIKVGAFFGLFQAGMPLLGWFVGQSLSSVVTAYTSLIAFILLALIGLKMIYEAFRSGDDKTRVNILGTKTLILLSIATSIDALIVGITLNLIELPLLLSVVIIGVITFILSSLGFLFGKKLGTFFEGKVEVFGGIALIAIGIKMLLP
jgi:putative Mn2+ efflux pump MntP